MDKPISIQNVKGNVTVTIVEGNNNQTQVTIGDFIEKTNIECGLKLIYEDIFKENSNTTSNFNEWLDGFTFNLRSIYYKREYRRAKVISTIEKKLEDKQRLLLLGESGTSKSTLLMEILCDYLSKGYKILHNIDPTASGEIKNLEYLENTLSLLIKDGNNVIVIVDNVHNKSISTIFSLIQKIKDDHEDKLVKIRFLLSARQPEFGWAMDRGMFDIDTIERIDRIFDIDKRYNIPYFTEEEIKGFIEKYEEYLHPSKRNKSIEDNAQEIFKDTKGHPIMVRFSVLQDGLKTHVKRMYTDHLLINKSPNIERIKSVIACSMYDISSIPLTDELLRIDLDLENASLEIVDTIIKKNDNSWTTIHPRWDLELFKYMFSLNEADRIKIKNAFSFILIKILDIHSKSFTQLDILNTVYNTIAAEQIIDIQIIQEMINIDDIVKKLHRFDKPEFFYTIGSAYNKLKEYENAIIWFNKSIVANPRFFSAYINKGYALSALGRHKEAIACYDKIIEINPQYADVYINKGISLYALGKYKEAIVYYDKVIEMNLRYSDAYFNKGKALSALGRHKEAIACYDKVIEISPLYADAYYNKGYILLNLGRYKEAIAIYEEAIVSYDKFIKINPQNIDAYYNKGNILSDFGRYKEAIACYDKVIKINPHYAFAYISKGNAFSDLGRHKEAFAFYEKAIACYDKVIETNPQNTYAYISKGNILSDLGRYKEAIACYDKVIEINPQYIEVYFNKGNILSTLGRKREAIACFTTILEYDPENLNGLLEKANSLIQLNKNREAKSLIYKILSIDPNNKSALKLKNMIGYQKPYQ